MLENLEKLLQEEAKVLMADYSKVTRQQEDMIIPLASEVVICWLKEQVTRFNISAIIDFFNSTEVSISNPIIKTNISRFTHKLNFLNISQENSNAIGELLIPGIMKKLVDEVNNPINGRFNFKELLSQLAGRTDGKFDLNEISNKFNGFGEDE